MMKLIRNLPVALIATLLLVLGCSQTPPVYPVSGTVTLDGMPVENADIRFAAESDDQYAVRGRVINGKFTLFNPEGLAEGNYAVTIVAPTPEFEELALDSGSRIPAALIPSRVPEVYQRRGHLRATVSRDGPNVFDFPLSTSAH